MKAKSLPAKLLRLQLMTECSRYAMVTMLNYMQFDIQKAEPETT